MFRVVSPPIMRNSYHCIYSMWHYWDRYCYLLWTSRSLQVAVTVSVMPDTVDTVIWAPHDGWRCHPKHVEQFADVNKLSIVLYCWIIFDTYCAMYGPLNIQFVSWLFKHLQWFKTRNYFTLVVFLIFILIRGDHSTCRNIELLRQFLEPAKYFGLNSMRKKVRFFIDRRPRPFKQFWHSPVNNMWKMWETPAEFWLDIPRIRAHLGVVRVRVFGSNWKWGDTSFIAVFFLFVKQFAASPESSKKVQHSMIRHVHACFDSDGGHFEQLLWITTWCTIRTQALLNWKRLL